MSKSTVLDSTANTPASKVAELSLLLSNDANKDKCVLLVEGPDDRKFYSFYTDDKHVVLDVQEGCGLIPSILSLLATGSPYKDRIIGIKDADFDHIKGVVNSLDTLFVTDTHDWETMTMTEDCEAKVSIEVIDEKYDHVFDIVMSDISNYSYLKLFNDVEICGKGLDGIRFKGFPISRIYDGLNPCSIESCLQEVKNYGNNVSLNHFPQPIDITAFKQKYSQVELIQITCGHDIIHSLVCKFASILRKQPKDGYTTIEKLFRISYSKQYFEQTSLFQKIKMWSEANNRIIWAA